MSSGHADPGPAPSPAGSRVHLWYAVIFTFSVGALFALAYAVLARLIEQTDRQVLESKLGEYRAIYTAGGFRALEQAVRNENEAGRQKSLFIRLTNLRNDVVLARVPDEWVSFRDSESADAGLRRRVGIVRIPKDQERDFALASATMLDGSVLQVGRSTTSRETTLRPFRQAFLAVGGATVLLGLATGAWLARRSLQPVRDVVTTAKRIIETGDLDARVPTQPGGDELNEMARLFNTVLEKNAALVRAMRESLDNAAHDLRTPLTRLRGIAELALQNEDPAAAREALADCAEESERVLHMLRALMDITEAEAGMMRLDRQPSDLAKLIAEAAELFEFPAQEKGVTVTNHVAAPVTADVDPARMRQVFANLFDNAVKYTPPGGTVSVSARTAGDDIAISIRDTGVGIPPQEQSKIWARLYRGDKSRSQRGVGLGLSLVKAIVEAHSGRVSVQSREGEGAEFIVRLPVRPSSSGSQPIVRG
jgi:signal transduction histidine kinase